MPILNLGVVLGVYSLGDYAGGSGLLTVLIFGVTLANLPRTPHMTRQGARLLAFHALSLIHISAIRAGICEGLQWAGLQLDDKHNQETNAREGKISTDDSRLQAYVIPTDEELLIARDTVRCILGEPHPS